jgi:hypothetical protein
MCCVLTVCLQSHAGSSVLCCSDTPTAKQAALGITVSSCSEWLTTVLLNAAACAAFAACRRQDITQGRAC